MPHSSYLPFDFANLISASCSVSAYSHLRREGTIGKDCSCSSSLLPNVYLLAARMRMYIYMLVCSVIYDGLDIPVRACQDCLDIPVRACQNCLDTPVRACQDCREVLNTCMMHECSWLVYPASVLHGTQHLKTFLYSSSAYMPRELRSLTACISGLEASRYMPQSCQADHQQTTNHTS